MLQIFKCYSLNMIILLTGLGSALVYANAVLKVSGLVIKNYDKGL